MTIGLSLFVIMVGAILKFAVTAQLAGISLSTVGVILMVVGVIGLLVTMLIFAPRNRARGGVVEERVYDDRPATNARGGRSPDSLWIGPHG